MADPVSPKPPRPPGQPPPLPPRPLVAEPFALLNADPAPDTVRTRRDEMPPPELEEPPLTRGEANSLRQELILLREALPTLPGKTVPPVSIRTRSRRALNAALGTTATAGALAILTLAAGVAAKLWPQYADLILVIAQALGGGQ